MAFSNQRQLSPKASRKVRNVFSIYSGRSTVEIWQITKLSGDVTGTLTASKLKFIKEVQVFDQDFAEISGASGTTGYSSTTTLSGCGSGTLIYVVLVGGERRP